MVTGEGALVTHHFLSSRTNSASSESHVLLGVEAEEDRLEPRRELLYVDRAVAVLVEAPHQLKDLRSRARGVGEAG